MTTWTTRENPPEQYTRSSQRASVLSNYRNDASKGNRQTNYSIHADIEQRVLDRTRQVNSECIIILCCGEDVLKEVGMLMRRQISINLDLMLIRRERSKVVQGRYGAVLLVGFTPCLVEQPKQLATYQ